MEAIQRTGLAVDGSVDAALGMGWIGRPLGSESRVWNPDSMV